MKMLIQDFFLYFRTSFNPNQKNRAEANTDIKNARVFILRLLTKKISATTKRIKLNPKKMIACVFIVFIVKWFAGFFQCLTIANCTIIPDSTYACYLIRAHNIKFTPSHFKVNIVFSIIIFFMKSGFKNSGQRT